MSERDELVARLRNPLGAGITPTLWLNRAADQIERDKREIERLNAENVRLRKALTRIAGYRAAAHAYDDDTGHLRRCFDVEEVMLMEAIARAALNGEGET